MLYACLLLSCGELDIVSRLGVEMQVTGDELELVFLDITQENTTEPQAVALLRILLLAISASLFWCNRAD